MQSGAIVLAGWGFVLATTVHLVMAGWLMRRQWPDEPFGRRVMLLLVLASLASALWSAMHAAVLLLGQPWALAAVWPMTWLRLVAWLAWLGLSLVGKPSRWPAGAAGGVLGLVVATGGVALVLVVGRAAGATWSVQWLGAAMLALAVAVVVLVEQWLRAQSEDARWGSRPLAMALMAVFAFDAYLFSGLALFGGLDGDAYAMRGYTELVVAPLVWLSLARGSGWLGRLRVSQAAAFRSVALLLAGAYLLFVAGVGYYVRYFGGEWGRALQQGLVFMGLVLLATLALSGAMRARLKVYLSKNFFHYRYDYREEWLKFTQALSLQGTPRDIGQRVVRSLADLVESPGGALWVRAGPDGAFEPMGQWNLGFDAAEVPSRSEMVALMQDRGMVLNLQEWARSPDRYGGCQPPAWLQEMDRAWLVVPLRSAETLVGFVLLLQARARFDMNWEVYDLLKTAGSQAGSFLAQALATEALLEARKFDAFNRMSAFVVHDLKNIVTQLSLMLKNAQRLGSNPEFQRDMLMTVENSLEKMRQLMAQLRDGDSASEGSAGVDLEQVLAHCRRMAAGQGRELEIRSSQFLRARGHAQRLERVVGHWVQNAIEATSGGGEIWVGLERTGSFAKLVVGDGGVGMTDDFIRQDLFRPFRSTKGGGMGIGAYECQLYLRELGGKIQVRSRPGFGTEVEMLVPLLEAPSGPDLMALQSSD